MKVQRQETKHIDPFGRGRKFRVNSKCNGSRPRILNSITTRIQLTLFLKDHFASSIACEGSYGSTDTSEGTISMFKA